MPPLVCGSIRNLCGGVLNKIENKKSLRQKAKLHLLLVRVIIVVIVIAVVFFYSGKTKSNHTS